MKYLVRMEFDIKSIDFGDIVIDASSKDEAVRLAVHNYLNTNSELNIDYYAADVYDSSIKNNHDEWLVEEITDEKE